MSDVLQKLFAWWSKAAPVPPEAELFAPRFQYVGISPMVDADAWIFVARQAMPWPDAHVLAMVETGCAAAMVFEGTDPITGLYHRVSWVVELVEGRIARLIETTQHIDPAQDSSATRTEGAKS